MYVVPRGRSWPPRVCSSCSLSLQYNLPSLSEFLSPFITFLRVFIPFEGSYVLPVILFSCFSFYIVCRSFSVPVFPVYCFFVFVGYSYYHRITSVLQVSLTSPTNVVLFRCAQSWLCEYGAITDVLTYDCNYRYITDSMSQCTCQSSGVRCFS